MNRANPSRPMNAKAHPGTIVFIDGDTSEVIDTMSAAGLPDTMKFEETPEGTVPIVKVVAFTGGDIRRILEYGPQDQLLRATTQISAG
jgi:hypothetical protein